MKLTRYPAAVAGLMLTAAVLLSGCGGGSDRESTADSGTAAQPQSDQAGGRTNGDTTGNTEAGKPDTAGKGGSQPAFTRSIVRTGFLTIEAGEITPAREKVAAIVAGQRGMIASEHGGFDPDSKAGTAQLVVRVPSSAYDATVRRLTAEVGKVKEVRQESTDVTEQVVDVESRISTQRAALNRMRTLLTKANTIGEIVSVEAELTRRESDLEALLAKQKALEGQTELATITVTLVRPGEVPPENKDDRGFLAGLSKGWNAFTTTVSGLLTAVGAVLPFVATVALIGIPLWFVIRRNRRPATQPVVPQETQ
ncbi:DUF4349 domain-containing protein [Kribbella sp. NBC_01245]|uniref:DUF4349 domain-containing protein n=1 Tax=Kribbella sp. NBC_01245 TaxID=2903578 RepID=UPI002E2B4332|nr:DUF4349 domain-containing protein [Kribbella sp. NBC_01245]